MVASSLNIPTEIIRTVVAVAEMGSLTRAAKKLGISQPAATSQIKRVQEMIGGSLFTKTANGSVPTELGRLVIEQARRIVAAHDQMLRFGGLNQATQPVRLGISSIFVNDLLENQNARTMTNVTVRIDSCAEIAKHMVDSHIDIACLLETNLPQEISNLVIDECSEDMVWVTSPTFSLSPGKAIPILAWPGDTFMIVALERQGLPYNVVLHSREYHAKLHAAAAGLGITAMLKRLVPPHLAVANDSYLPALPPIRGLLCARPNLSEQARALTSRIAARYFKANGN